MITETDAQSENSIYTDVRLLWTWFGHNFTLIFTKRLAYHAINLNPSPKIISKQRYVPVKQKLLPDPFTRTLVEWRATANAMNIRIPSNENIPSATRRCGAGKRDLLLHAQAQALWQLHRNFPRPSP